MRLKTFLKLSGATLLTGFLAACGSSNSAAPPPPAPAASLESKFGSEFALIYDAPSTSQPDALDNESANPVPPLQPAAQPISIP